MKTLLLLLCLCGSANAGTLVTANEVSTNTVAVLYSSHTWTGSNTFSQTGAGVTTISSASLSYVNLPTRDKISFGNEVSNSSSTTWGAYSTTQASAIACVTGSTLTITTQLGSRIAIHYNGAANMSSGATGLIYYKLDGVTSRIMTAFGGVTSGIANISFNALTSVLSPGSHSVCIAGVSDGSATLTFNTNVGMFWIEEVR